MGHGVLYDTATVNDATGDGGDGIDAFDHDLTYEEVTDEELTELALAADPDLPLDPRAKPIAGYLDASPGSLPRVVHAHGRRRAGDAPAHGRGARHRRCLPARHSRRPLRHVRAGGRRLGIPRSAGTSPALAAAVKSSKSRSFWSA